MTVKCPNCRGRPQTDDLDDQDEWQWFNHDRTRRVVGSWNVDGEFELFVFHRTPRAVEDADSELESYEDENDDEMPTEAMESETEEEGATATGIGLVQEMLDQNHIHVKVKSGRFTEDEEE
jgi:hypothetical protein